MRTRTTVATAALVLVATALGLWALRPRPASASEGAAISRDHGSAVRRPEGPAPVHPDAPARRRGRVSTKAEPRSPGLLTVKVVDANGDPTAGQVYWTTSEDPPVTANLLAPDAVRPYLTVAVFSGM